MDSFRRKIGFSSLALALQGCTLGPDLKDTAATARDAVLAVRPQADLKGVRVQLFTPSMDLKALLKDDSSGFSLPELRRVIDENAPSFVRISLLDSKDAEMLRDEFADLYMLDAAGVALYSAGLILIAPDHAGSVETCAHELAHIGSARMGYFAGCLQKYFPRAGGRPDPAWVDVDAMLASKLLCEADAEFTAKAAEAFRQGGDSGLSELWQRHVPVDQPKGQGPLKIVSPKGVVLLDVGPGEPFYDDRMGTLEALQWLAYGGSVGLVLARHKEGESVEDTVRRAWTEFSYTTKELLYPEKPSAPSRFVQAWRSLGDGLSGATRAGAFLVRSMISRKFKLSHQQIIDMAASFEDDVLFRCAQASLMWVSRWTDEASAKRFARLYQDVLRDGKIETDGALVITTVGEFQGREKLLSLLR